jgi:glucose/arabinose dehydrogenase
MSVEDRPWELVAGGWHFPTSLALDGAGMAYLAESGLTFAGAPAGGRVWRIDPDGERTLLADDLGAPVNGLALHGGELYVSEGGHPGRITRLGLDRSRTTVLDGLPGPGDYHTNMAVVGPDDKLYFSQGALTNLGVVGLDAFAIGWLRRLPDGRDLPGYGITLAGHNVTTPDPTSSQRGAEATTGGFSPFGTASASGQRVAAELPATAALMRCDLDGSNLELVAWGLRNAYGLGFLPDGRLLAVDQGADDRGSRAVGEAPDLLFEVQVGRWYGWPDFIGGVPVTDERFLPARGEPPTMLLTAHEELPPPEQPLLVFPPHAAAVKFDVVPDTGRHAGDLYVALFGDEVPMTAPTGPRVGRSVARVATADWTLHPLAHGPARRPIDVRIDAIGGWVYVVDFGQFEMTDTGVDAEAGSGGLWRFPLPTGSADAPGLS